MKQTLSNRLFEIKRICRMLCAALLCFVMSGCYIFQPLTFSEPGCGPYPDNYESMIMDYLKQDLRHPESIKDFVIIKPPEIMILDTWIRSLDLRIGFEVWEFFVVYDVQNDNGIYIGRDLHVVWIRDNRLIAFDYKELSLEYRIKERDKMHGDF